MIDDKTTTGIAMKHEVLQVQPDFQKKAKFIFLEDFDIPELKQQVKNIPPDSIILLLFSEPRQDREFFHASGRADR